MNRDDEEILAIARVGFLEEAADMLRQFEQALLIMETDPGDTENLNAAFRAAHTIKGTAGLFGFDAVVSFTHEAEALLESLRAGRIQVSEPVIALLLQSRDQMEALLAEVASGEQDPSIAEASRELGAALRAAMGGPTAAAEAPRAAAAPTEPGATQWAIGLRFGPDALRNGLDPLSFIRYLGTLGRIDEIRLLEDAIPPLDQLDAEACYLGFDILFSGTATREQIQQVFEFCIDDCALTLQALSAPEADAADGDAHDSDTHEAHAPDDAPTHGTAAATDRRTGERRTADRRAGSDDARVVKVRADKLDRLIDLIGELVIASSGANLVAHTENSPAMIEAAQRISDLVEEARDGALALRMVPIGDTFARFQRVVRDLSKQLGKEVELVVTGGDAEMDKSMVETIADPLMHLVRNSLDHGIEPVEARLAAGKPAQGRLAFNAYHESGSIVIEVSDDGRGLDSARILAKAIERGLISADDELSEEEVYQLIFLPGFSTAEAVTNISGRGVGMDVVKRNIESLRGQIRVASTPGRGATMQIRLPLTLAMIDGFLTQVGKVHYVLPLAVVAECIDVPPECRADPDRVCGTFDLRGQLLPYLDLARFYGAPRTEQRRRSLIVVNQGETHIGIVVDRLLGEHQTVIKPLAPMFRHLQALAGSTILGSGEVALVLDMQGLIAAAGRHGTTYRHSHAFAAGTAPLNSQSIG
ncbi:chemotaxis protein CheA [Ideonella sp. DXS29W]|uniref:Chemotaxis protein CheA n=1 Tax=Ideonella lacteola TaxID=2984193 RepID=A0ABU9BX85_9BURK